MVEISWTLNTWTYVLQFKCGDDDDNPERMARGRAGPSGDHAITRPSVDWNYHWAHTKPTPFRIATRLQFKFILQLPKQLQQYDTQLWFLVAINFQLQRLLYTIATQLQHINIYNIAIATHVSHNYNITTPELQHICPCVQCPCNCNHIQLSHNGNICVHDNNVYAIATTTHTNYGHVLEQHVLERTPGPTGPLGRVRLWHEHLSFYECLLADLAACTGIMLHGYNVFLYCFSIPDQ